MYNMYKFALAKQVCPLYNKIRIIFNGNGFWKVASYKKRRVGMTGRRLFKRILRGYIALAVVFTIIFGISFYIGAYSNARERFKTQTDDVLSGLSNDADRCLDAVKQAWERLGHEEAVYTYSMPDGEQSYSPLQRAIKENSKGLSEQGINIYISKLANAFSYVVGENKLTGAYDFWRSLNFSTGANEGIRNFFSKNENKGKVFVTYCRRSTSDEGLLVMADKAETENGALYMIATMELYELPNDAVLSGGSFAMMNGQNMICNIGENTIKTTDGINNSIKRKISALGSMVEFAEDYIYAVSQSDVYGWNYVFAKPADELAKSVAQIFFSILAMCCAIFLLCWGLLLLLTRWIYSPVNETVEFLSRYTTENLSDEGLLVRQSFVRMAKDKQTLQEKLDETVFPLRTKFLRDLLFGLVSDEQLNACVRELGIEDISGPYRVVLLKFADYGLLCEAFEQKSIEKIKFQIREFIDDQLKDQIIHGALDIDQSTIAVISYGQNLRELREILADMAMMVEGGFDVEVVGAIGADCDRLSGLADSYNSSQMVMENRFSTGSRNAIVTEEEVNAANAEGFFYPLDTERELIAEVIRARSEEVHRILDLMLEENFVNRNLSRDRINAFIFAITASVNRIVESQNKTVDDIFGEGNIIFLDLKMCTSSESLKDKIYEIFDTLISYINAASKLEQDNLADKMLEYIHLHYNEDISLLDIGGHFNLSQCYTSTLFKEATGENFKEYLSRYRIKMAKQILDKEPNIKNNELASRIGCNTVATLFRLFNKYEGISPGQYVKGMKE